MSKWETGSAVPNSENITVLCKLFNVSADYFLDDSKEIAVGSAEVAESTEGIEQGNDEEKPKIAVGTNAKSKSTGKRTWIVLITVFAVLCAVSISFSSVLIVMLLLDGDGYEVVYAFRAKEWLLGVCIICTVVFLASLLVTIFYKGKFCKHNS